MKVFAIGDLHLSINNPKPMDIFGPVWEGYLDTIEKDWEEKVSDDDVVLIPGDISWAMKMTDAKADLDYISKLKGKKIIIKGNHDYWWNSISALRDGLNNNTFALQNDALKFDNVIVCGSRGWMVPENGFKSPQDEKIYKRELIRMELSLRSAAALRNPEDEVIVMTHFPPFNYRMEDNEMMALFEKYKVNIVVFGHLHSYDTSQKLKFKKNGIDYFLVSCDMIDNKLVQIL